jgi:hypothetical protein
VKTARRSMPNDRCLRSDTAVAFSTACGIAFRLVSRYGTSTDQIDRGRGVGARRQPDRACRGRDVAWRPGGACSSRSAAAAGTAAALESSVTDDEREHTAGSPMTGASTACPLCHTAGPSLGDVNETRGASWRCTVCHQVWTARRLATVAAYADFCAQRAATAGSAPKRN